MNFLKSFARHVPKYLLAFFFTMLFIFLISNDLRENKFLNRSTPQSIQDDKNNRFYITATKPTQFFVFLFGDKLFNPNGTTFGILEGDFGLSDSTPIDVNTEIKKSLKISLPIFFGAFLTICIGSLIIALALNHYSSQKNKRIGTNCLLFLLSIPPFLYAIPPVWWFESTTPHWLLFFVIILTFVPNLTNLLRKYPPYSQQENNNPLSTKQLFSYYCQQIIQRIPFLLSSMVLWLIIFEYIFRVEGMGHLLIRSINHRDANVMWGTICVFSIFLMINRFVGEGLIHWLEKRATFQECLNVPMN